MILVAPLLTALLTVSAAPEGQLERLQQQEEARYHERSSAIARELTALREHPWAAIYRRSNGMGIESVGLAPLAGAGFGSPGCMGLMRLNHGQISRTGAGWVEVAWQIDPNLDTLEYLGKRQPLLSPRLLLIDWDKERFLVPEGRSMEFVNAVNAHDELLVSRFWRRGEAHIVGFPELPAGQPLLPEKMRSCLLDTPVRCRATSVHDMTEPGANGVQHLWRTVEVDAGSLQKLRVGMCLFAGSREIAGEIVEVRENTARVEFRSFGTNSQRTSLKPGTELTTRPPKR